MSEITICVSGLSKIDKLELENTPGVTFEEISVPPGAHGELTLFTAYFAMTALAGLVAYLLRKNNNESFEETVTVIENGRTEIRRVKWNRASTEAPESAIIKQIRGPF